MRRLRPEKPNPTRAYRQLWRLVDGGVADCLAHHPEYIAPGISMRVVRNSITKRVTGSVLGYAVETAKGRSSASEAADSGRARSLWHVLVRASNGVRSALDARLRALWEIGARPYPSGEVLNAWLVVLLAIACVLLPAQYESERTSSHQKYQVPIVGRQVNA